MCIVYIAFVLGCLSTIVNNLIHNVHGLTYIYIYIYKCRTYKYYDCTHILIDIDLFTIYLLTMQIFGTLTPTIMFHFQLMNIIVCLYVYWTFLYIKDSLSIHIIICGYILMWLYISIVWQFLRLIISALCCIYINNT